ncbi:MAG: hypothetical protein IJD03_00765 [Clostridia bacterium]|nr:hypothetical protein [Clostridia bacterium]
MSKKQVLIRMMVLSVVMALIAGVLSLRLVYLQLVKGEEYRASAANQTSVRYNIKASRGEIYDRNGLKVVSNQLSYSVRFNYFDWDRQSQNSVILEVCSILKSSGLTWNDSLPITAGYPFAYTYDSPDSRAAKDLKEFCESNLDLDGLEAEDIKDDGLPNAAVLFELLCEEFGIDPSLPLNERRLIAGVRYEMKLREFSRYTPFTLASDLDIDTGAHIVQMYQELPGVTIEPDSSRKYETSCAAHLLGFIGPIYKEEYAELKDQGYGLNDTLGKAGLEKAFESWLHGIDGKETVVSDVTGEVVDRYVSTEPQPGDNVFLTIDMELQEVTERALAETIENIRAKGRYSVSGAGADAEGGAAVVIDVNSGEILAMASYPTYSLENYNADYNALLQDPLTPLLNRATMGLYPPGSTFKMVTSVAALEEDIINPNTKIRDLGRYTYYDDYQPRCWIFKDRGITHGLINVSEALKYSCNYFYYEVGRVMGIDTLVGWAEKLGLGQKTGVEVGEYAGQIASPETIADWQGGLTLQVAIGQSAHQFTPIQLANYVATIVNGGTRYQPHLLKKVMDYSLSSTVDEAEPTVLDTIELDPSTINAVKAGMRGVVTEDGTASSVFVGFPIEVGGKTGSAQTRSGRSAHGVFVSFAPYDEPEIAVCVVGEFAGSGGSVAPVVVEIYNQYFGLNTQEIPENDGAATN